MNAIIMPFLLMLIALYSCLHCGKSVGNRGALGYHMKSCAERIVSELPAASREAVNEVAFSSNLIDPETLPPALKKRILAEKAINTARESGNPAAPYPSMADLRLGQLMNEENLGKRKRERLISLLQHPDMQNQCKLTSERAHKAVESELSPLVSVFLCFRQSYDRI